MSLKRHPDKLQIRIDGNSSMLNAVGIQPIFHSDGVLERACRFFCFRDTRIVHGKAKEKYAYNLRISEGAETRKIATHCYAFEDMNRRLSWLMYYNSRHFYMTGDLDTYFAEDKDARDNLLLLSQMMLCTNRMYRGNCIILSNRNAYEQIRKMEFRGRDFELILVSPDIVPLQEFHMVSKGDMNFDNPILACPLIERKHFNEFAHTRGLNDFKVDAKKNYFPIIQRNHHVYKVYEEYINTFKPRAWYTEIFRRRSKYFFTTIHMLQTERWKEKQARKDAGEITAEL